MKHFTIAILTALILLLAATADLPAQSPDRPAVPPPPPPMRASLSSRLEANLNKHGKEVSREEREHAYVKLLEGQRYIRGSLRLRSRAGIEGSTRMAREAFVKALENDPYLAEAYTALAELELRTAQTESDLAEAIGLATLATRVGPNNIGSRRILARLFVERSNVGGGAYNVEAGARAVAEWKEVARLDDRNAEAWAFLAALYERTGDQEARIEALKKWIASATPLEQQWYRHVMGREENLMPESARLKLASAYISLGRTADAVDVLTTILAGDPNDQVALVLLREAVETASGASAAPAVVLLRAAVLKDPGSITLVEVLGDLMIRSGRSDEMIRLYSDLTERSMGANRVTAAALQVSLGDKLYRLERYDDAAAAYENALTVRGLAGAATLGDDDREFALGVFDKLIRALRAGARPEDAKRTIERARRLFADEGLFADRQLISLYRELGMRQEALAIVNRLRTRVPSDMGILRLEATLLTELGRVDEAVRKLRRGAEQPRPPDQGAEAGSNRVTVVSSGRAQDQFSMLLFITNLYINANRGKEAADAAMEALDAATGAERRQLAMLALAAARNRAGDRAGAEKTLREILAASPNNHIAQNNLGYLLLENDDRLGEALGLIENAYKVDPTNPAFLDSLGWAHFRLGDLEKAEAFLREAISFDQNSATAHEHLGDVLSGRGQTDAAMRSWERALKRYFDPEDVSRVQEKLKRSARR
jgi:tetratricopeptide (TPR) repeat protein